MIYSDNGPRRRIYRPLKRRPVQGLSERDLAVIADVIAEFPSFGPDEVAAAARSRGAAASPDLVRAVMEES